MFYIHLFLFVLHFIIFIINGKNCIYNNTKLDNYQIQFIIGNENILNSIYISCLNGILKCYQNDGIADNIDDEINCPTDDLMIYNNKRNLGILNPFKLNKKWPNGIICYYPLHNGYTIKEKRIFNQAIKEYHLKTNIQFITISNCHKRSDSKDICNQCTFGLKIIKSSNICTSFIGYLGNNPLYNKIGQRLNLGKKCFLNGPSIIMHELGHAAGLFHEHIHPKRNVIVLRSNLKSPSSSINYIIKKNKLYTKYDKKSIMHYDVGKNYVLCVPKYKNIKYCDVNESKELNNCIIPTIHDCDYSKKALNGYNKRKHLSKGDIDSLKILYG